MLDQKILAAFSRVQETEKATVDVCQCPARGGTLTYDACSELYIHEGICSRSRLCFRLMRDKHQLLIKEGRLRSSDQSSNHVTLDHFLPSN